MTNRREFIQTVTAAGAALVAPWQITVRRALAGPLEVASPSLTKWQDELPVPPVAKLARVNPQQGPGPYYEVKLVGAKHQFHKNLPVTNPAAAANWAYQTADVRATYLGPTIVARTGIPTIVNFDNSGLPSVPVVADAIDTDIFRNGHTSPSPSHWPTIRSITHLHGGLTAPLYDGHPEAWSAPGTWRNPGANNGANTGHHFVPGPFTYTNAQRASMLWYHDHAMGITRLNVYAGLAALYVIRDNVDTGVPGLGLRLPVGEYEVPIVIQDRIFNADGTLHYPTTNDLDPPYPYRKWVPEFFGDTSVVNGKAYPYLEVEPRRYRLRLLNGSNARFYNLWFENDGDGSRLGFHVIGTDGGLLPAPVPFGALAGGKTLLMAPAERFDVILDFSQVPFNSTITLENDAPIPFPDGDPADLEEIMQFRVTKRMRSKDLSTPAANLALPSIETLVPTPGRPKRPIVLTEEMDEATDEPLFALINDRFFLDPIDEEPKAGTTEEWLLINATGDAHPIHLHLVMFQVVNRQHFGDEDYLTDYRLWVSGDRMGTAPDVTSYLQGSAMPRPPEEAGWKDTVVAMPGEVTRIRAKFDLPPGVTPPAEYVYHCHILEHEDNEMMRPFRVVA
jgi:spore coat protein A, manganese oxidase